MAFFRTRALTLAGIVTTREVIKKHALRPVLFQDTRVDPKLLPGCVGHDSETLSKFVDKTQDERAMLDVGADDE
jgi:hypothetical protein